MEHETAPLPTPDPVSSSEDDRGEFPKRCGKFAATVPPAVTILLSTSLTPRPSLDRAMATGRAWRRGMENAAGRSNLGAPSRLMVSVTSNPCPRPVASCRVRFFRGIPLPYLNLDSVERLIGIAWAFSHAGGRTRRGRSMHLGLRLHCSKAPLQGRGVDQARSFAEAPSSRCRQTVTRQSAMSPAWDRQGPRARQCPHRRWRVPHLQVKRSSPPGSAE